MKITLLVFLLLSICIFCGSVAGGFESAGPIQIVTPVNRSFELELDELKFILEADDIKNRDVVVVSIAGAYRKGKSFMLNFFLKYLYAQVNFFSFEKKNCEFLLIFCLEMIFKSLTSISFMSWKLRFPEIEKKKS